MEAIKESAVFMDVLLTTYLAIPCEVAHYILVVSSVKQNWG